MGKLQKMLDSQSVFQARLGTYISRLSYKESTGFIKEHSIHTIQELNEMLYELPYFKPWKDYGNMTVDEIIEARAKAKEEFIDMLHFMLNIALALGMDEAEIYEMYLAKNAVNHERQDKGYTHDVIYRPEVSE